VALIAGFMSDSYVRVVTDCMRAQAVFGATDLYRAVRENHIIEPSPVESPEAALTVYLIYNSSVEWHAVQRVRNG
jgi:hypothetical protein